MVLLWWALLCSLKRCLSFALWIQYIVLLVGLCKWFYTFTRSQSVSQDIYNSCFRHFHSKNKYIHIHHSFYGKLSHQLYLVSHMLAYCTPIEFTSQCRFIAAALPFLFYIKVPGSGLINLMFYKGFCMKSLTIRLAHSLSVKITIFKESIILFTSHLIAYINDKRKQFVTVQLLKLWFD